MPGEVVLQCALDAIRVRVIRILPAQIRACADSLTDDQLWWRPNDESNSVGNLILHLSGSLNHYLNRAVGGHPYDRDRAAEFSERGPLPRQLLLSTFNEMVTKAESTFAQLSLERLGEPSPEPKLYTLLVEDLLSVLTHLANHAGQIVWITKMLHAGSIDDVWISTHKELGGWKRRA